MRRFLIVLSCYFLTFLSADSGTFSLDRLETFYTEFMCEEKDILSKVNLSDSCSGSNTDCGPLLSRPTIPPLAQALDLQHVPIVLVNNTGLPDDQVYFTAYGRTVTLPPPPGSCPGTGALTFAFLNFGPQGGPFTAIGTLNGTTGGGNTTAYSYQFSQIPLSNGQRILYVPYINSGIIFFSIGPLTLYSGAVGSIAAPVVTDPSDSAYNTVYGAMELTFLPPSCGSPVLNQLTIDFTCVDFYGLSLYLNLHTDNPAPGLPKDRPSGIFQSRHYTLCSMQKILATAFPATLSQWEGLVLKNNGKTLRIASPGYSMSHTGGTFDINYFDNAPAYGFSWKNDVWDGTYYASGQHDLLLTTNDGTVFKGNTSGGNFVFTATSGPGVGTTITVPWLNSGTPTTSTALFNVEASFPGMVGGGSYQAEFTKILSSSIVAGLVPGKVSTLPNNGYPQSIIDIYYTPNTNLNNPGPTTGPWYDLYSLALQANQTVTENAVYTYPYDDYLYSQASFNVAPSQAVFDITTYVTVVLGPYSDN
jgi:hypothetical protein